jgi:hypothetical protein
MFLKMRDELGSYFPREGREVRIFKKGRTFWRRMFYFF